MKPMDEHKTDDFFPTYRGRRMLRFVTCKRCGGSKFTRTYHGPRLDKTSFRCHACKQDVEVE